VQNERYNAEVRAEQEVGFAEESLRAAHSDKFGDSGERAALVRSISEEVELAQTRLDEAKVSLEKVRLRGKALGAMHMVAKLTSLLERYRILVDWVERQRRAMASECANSIQNAENDDARSLDQRPKQRSLRSSAAQASRTSQSFDGSGLGRKRKRTTSVLSAIEPSRVSKASRTEKATTRRKENMPANASQTAQAASVDPGFSTPRSKRTHKPKDALPPPLRPIHPSKVSKSNGRQSSGLQASGTAPLRKTARLHSNRELRLRLSSAGSIGLEPRSKPASAPMRRSARIAERVEKIGVQ
jgi:hypothetical protein